MTNPTTAAVTVPTTVPGAVSGAETGPTTEQFADRLFAAALGTVELMSVYLGDRLGWYRSLAEQGPATAAELALRSASAERYAREWLEQQA
jgi:hypothetical protein